jgi:chromosome segregation ATPase
VTETEYKLLAVFEERIHELIRLYDEKKHHIEELKKSLKEKDEIIRRDKQTIETLQAKYTSLHTACRLAGDDGEFQNARKRVNKLVREIDTCIALLIE